MVENQKQWFVVHTYSGYEDRVKKNLEQRIKFMDAESEIAQIVIPTEEEIEVKSGQRRTVTKKTLPGYVLIQMKMSDQSWNFVGIVDDISLGKGKVKVLLSLFGRETPVELDFLQVEKL